MTSSKAASDQREAAKPKKWASGRVLSEAQRARKREVDRNARRTFKRAYQQRVAELEEKVRILSENGQNTPGSSQFSASPASMSNASIASSSLAYGPVPPAGSIHEQPELAAASPQNLDRDVQFDMPAEIDRILSQPGPVYFKSSPGQPGDEPLLQGEGPLLQGEGLMAENSTQQLPIQDWTAPELGPSPNDLNTLAISGPPTSRYSLTADGANVTHLFNALVRYIRSLNASLICIDDARNQDFLVRALVVSWDHALSRNDQKCPLWNVLRLVDFWLLKDCNFLERLSLLRLLHRMYMFELTGWTSVPQNIPPWYKPRPVQRRFSHDPVVDHLGWPGLRERLVLEGTGILTNGFWAAFSNNVRFCWSKAPLEAVVFDDSTAQYSLSGEFQYCLSSLAHWRMDTPFFTQFPSLFDDFALDEQIPFPISLPLDLNLSATRMNRMIVSTTDPNIPKIHEEESDPTTKLKETLVP